MSRIRVPLAVDSQVRIPLGPVQLPIRNCFALGIALVPMCIAFELPLGIGTRIAAVTFILGTAVAASSPTREGMWIGTFLLLRLAQRFFPTTTVDGAVPREVPTQRTGWKRCVPRFTLPAAAPRLLDPSARRAIEDGLFEIAPGGWRAVVALEGPACAVDSPTYARWCSNVMTWLRALNVPAQLVTVVGHVNRLQALDAFDNTSDFEPRYGPLVQREREFAGDSAVRSLSFTHLVVLAPRMAGADGLPSRLSPFADASRGDAEHVLSQAMTAAKSAGLTVLTASVDVIYDMLATSTLGPRSAAADSDGVAIDDLRCATVIVTKLGSDVDWGMLVDVIQRSGMHGAVSLHLLPVTRALVRQQLNRRRLWMRYAMREGRPDIDLEVALHDIEQLQVELAAGRAEGLRIALSFRILAGGVDELTTTIERLRSILAGHGWQTERITTPSLAPATVAAPGTAPLRRNTLLTTDYVAARLLPALGTPFARVGDPIVGVNLRAGSSAYLSVFTRPNFNAVVVGSSGAGKSVAAKTLLARHVMRGAGACVLDPDSEYSTLIKLLGGRYFELPHDALNPLALGRAETPDMAAARIVPVLSVMAGDETEYVGGRPIRRLPNEDKAWLHHALRSFLVDWRSQVARNSAPTNREFRAQNSEGLGGWQSHTPHLELVAGQYEPLLSDLLDYLGRDKDLTPERCRRIILRLRGFTQGQLGEIFDRQSSFAITPGQVTGIGFRALSLAYAADLTPALCVVLSHVLDAILRASDRMVVLVDEAHVLTSDPDAGHVLEQLVRRARKCKAGVWMCSQKIEEFTSTDLGRTLASTAATKVVLGHEDTVAERVRELFGLAEDESSALTPPVPGRAVLISGSERTIVQVTPSPVLWPFVGTSEEQAA